MPKNGCLNFTLIRRKAQLKLINLLKESIFASEFQQRLTNLLKLRCTTCLDWLVGYRLKANFPLMGPKEKAEEKTEKKGILVKLE